MNIVKAPQKWDAMIRQMPIIKCQVHKQKAQRELSRRRQRREMNETERGFRRPAQCPARRRLHQRDCCDKCKDGDCNIDNESREQGSRALAQRKKALEQKQYECKNANCNYRSHRCHFSLCTRPSHRRTLQLASFNARRDFSQRKQSKQSKCLIAWAEKVCTIDEVIALL